jgi:hypothetical protein
MEVEMKRNWTGLKNGGVLLAFLGLGLLLGGCGGSGGAGDSAVSGADDGYKPSLRISITDAPFPLGDVVSAIVEVERVDLRMVGGEFEELISFTDRQFDLLELQNGVTEVLFEGNPPMGDYDALRVIVHPVSITILNEQRNEETFTEFKVPSGPQTGVKVFVDPVISVVTSLTMDLMLDMDLGRSFVAQGNPDTPAGIKSFHFKPVVRAINVSTAGTLTFRVLSDNGTPSELSDDFYLNGAAYDVVDTSGPTPLIVASGLSGPMPIDGIPSLDPMDQGYVFHPAIPSGDFDIEVTRTGYESYADTLTIWVANLTDLGDITLAANEASLGGTVTTAVTPLSGTPVTLPLFEATVTAAPDGAGDTPAPVLTAIDGSYLISFIPPVAALYDITGSKAGYSDDMVQAQPGVGGEDSVTADLMLLPLTADLEVWVTDGTDLVADLTVNVLLTATDELMATDITNADTPVTFALLPTGAYTVKVMDGDIELASVAHDHLGGGPVDPLEIELP